jgi:hypothetical protein
MKKLLLLSTLLALALPQAFGQQTFGPPRFPDFAIGDIVGTDRYLVEDVSPFKTKSLQLEIQREWFFTYLPKTDGFLRLDEHATAPGTPAAGSSVIYAKQDGLWYSKDDAGVETLMSGGSGGGAFSDAGDPIVQNTTTKDTHFGDGAGTLTGKVEIGGDADQPQLVIEAHSTQTDDVLIIQNDADTEVFSVSVAGAVTAGDVISNGLLLGPGDVSLSGTPDDNQLAVWVGDSAIEGDPNLTWDGTTLTVNGAYSATTVSTTNLVLADGGALKVDASANAIANNKSRAFRVFSGRVSGEALNQWDLVYLNNADGKWWKADADLSAAAGKAWGAVTEGVAGADELVDVVVSGIIRNDAWNWNIGVDLYVSDTAGALTETAPATTGDVVKLVARTLSDDEIYLDVTNHFLIAD